MRPGFIAVQPGIEAQPYGCRRRTAGQGMPFRISQPLRANARPPHAAGRIAQLVEQLTLNQRVAGSSPAAPTKEIKELSKISFLTIKLCPHCVRF